MKGTQTHLALAALATSVLAVAVPAKIPIVDSSTLNITVLPDGVSPLEARDSIIAKRDAGVYLCDNAPFTGYCVHIPSPFGQCGKSKSYAREWITGFRLGLAPGANADCLPVNLASDLNDLVSSVGPDGSAYCIFYR